MGREASRGRYAPVEIRPEALFEAVRVKAEEALEAVVVVALCVLLREVPELFVHCPVERVTQEKAPEAEERVHFVRRARPLEPSVLDAALVILRVTHLQDGHM